MVSKKKNPYSYEDGIEKSVHRDHRLSSLENPRILMNRWTDRWMDGWMDKPKTIELHKPINPYVKFGSNLVINGRVSTKCKVKGGSHFVSHLSYRSLDKTHIPT